MKKLLFIPIIASLFLFATEDNNSTKAEDKKNAEQIITMQNLEVAMATIQKGFIYNNNDLVKGGIQKLKDNVKNIKSFDIKNDKNRDFDAKKYSLTELKAITQLADNMATGFDKGDKEIVLEDFQKTLNRCVTCHLLVRKW
jgi:formyltetrahydrofolate synthetase